MAAIIEELTIEACPQRVYKALTRADEIARWWAYEAHVKPEVGSVGEFRFRQGAFVMQLEVAELEQDKKVRWVSRQVTPQWAGTSVTCSSPPSSTAPPCSLRIMGSPSSMSGQGKPGSTSWPV